jgi:hypothetical protein
MRPSQNTFNGNLISRGDLVVGSASCRRRKGQCLIDRRYRGCARPSQLPAAASRQWRHEFSLLFTDQSVALPTVDLAPGSVLSVAGTTLLTPNPLGYRLNPFYPADR